MKTKKVYFSLKHSVVTGIVFLGFLLSIFLIDIILFRGFYSVKYFASTDRTKKDIEIEIEYSIKKVNNNWELTFSNNSVNFYYFLMYRNDKEFITLPDSFYFKENRFKLISDSLIYECESDFMCGTGLGPFLIFPKEKRKFITKNLADLVPYDHYPYFKDKVIDLDSLRISFFVPVYSLTSGSPQKVFSNEIVLGKENFVKTIVNKIERVKKIYPIL